MYVINTDCFYLLKNTGYFFSFGAYRACAYINCSRVPCYVYHYVYEYVWYHTHLCEFWFFHYYSDLCFTNSIHLCM